jgi:hypothetical protein
VFVFASLNIGCHKNYSYLPKGLRKLTKNESLDRNVNGIPPSINVIFKDTSGEIIPQNKLDKMLSTSKYYLDEFVDQEDIVQLFVVRKARLEDKKWRKELKKRIQEESLKIGQIEVNCSEKRIILEKIYDSDKTNRALGSVYKQTTDNENQQIVMNIIETCGFPTKNEVGENGMTAIFLALQHGNPTGRKEYFPLLKKACRKGDIEQQYIALLEDRILVDEGEKQIYGTQLIKINDGELKLAPLVNPQKVNKRREKVGLTPIEDYLKKWNLEFNAD